jgi:hypothetical protein
MKEIKAYQCAYCKKVSRTITGIKLHEKVCKSNPEVNLCSNCKYGILKYDDADEFGWRQARPYCDYHKMFIFHENKSNNAYFVECDVDYCWDGGEHSVPFSCFGFESKGKHGFDPIEEIVQAPTLF